MRTAGIGLRGASARLIPVPANNRKTPSPHAFAGENGVTRVATSIPLPPLMLRLPPIPPRTGNRLRSTGPAQRIPPPPRHQIRPLRLLHLRNQHPLPMPGQHILAHRHLLPMLDHVRQRYPRPQHRHHRFFTRTAVRTESCGAWSRHARGVGTPRDDIADAVHGVLKVQIPYRMPPGPLAVIRNAPAGQNADFRPTGTVVASGYRMY